MSSLGGGFSQIRRRSHAQNRITALVREFQRFTASQIKIENPDFRTLNRTTSSRMKYTDNFVYATRKSVVSQFVMPFEPDFNHTALMLKMDHVGRRSKDASGFGHHGQILGKQELKQGIDNGYGPTLYQNFDGETTYVQIKDRYNLLNSSTYIKGFSLACRIYPEDLADNSFDQTKSRTILSKHDDINGVNGYILAVLPDGALQYTFMRNGTPYSVSTPANTIRLDTTTEADDQLLIGEEITPVIEPIPYDITVTTSINNPGINLQTDVVPIQIQQFGASAAADFGADTFGIKKLYADDPAKPNHWFLANLSSDPMVDLSGSVNNLGGGVWEGHVTTSDNPASFRINVKTKSCQNDFSDSLQTLRGENWVRREADGYTCKPDDWRDVEMTIFWKVTTWSASDEMSPYVRGGSHHDGWKIACIATEYKGQIQKAGNSRFAKEFHHLSGNTGYSFIPGAQKFANLSDRTNVWTGHKFVCYDFVRASDGKKCVMNQVWVETSDEANGNPTTQNWRLMNELVDDGTLPDCPEKGYVQNCAGIAKQVFRWGSGMATFRIDNVVVQVKKASIRNILGSGGGIITPPPPPVTCPAGKHEDPVTHLCVDDVTNPPPPPTTINDKFGVRMIYPTIGAGETWFLNAANNAQDARSLLPTSGLVATNPETDVINVKSTTGIRWGIVTSTSFNASLSVPSQQLLKNIGFMQDSHDWKNVEMTSYFRIKHTTTSTANGGQHVEMMVRRAAGNSSFPCLGTGYHLANYPDGRIQFYKELAFGNTSTNSPVKEQAALSWVTGQWFGLKHIVRNTNTGTVKMECWLDSTGNNTWVKVFETEDIGQITVATVPPCGGSNHQIISWGGPLATYRWDSVDDIDVKWMSIREILPTTSAALPIDDTVTDPGGGGGGPPPLVCPEGQVWSSELQKCVFTGAPPPPPPAGHNNALGIKCFFADPETPRFYTHTTTQGHQGSDDDPLRFNFNLPQDVLSTEFSCLIKIQTPIDEHITVKLGGGIHNSKIKNDGCCYDFGIVVHGQTSNSAVRDRLLRKECPHPEYNPCSGAGGNAIIAPLFNLGSIYNQEIGLACIKVNQATSNAVLLQVWINLTPTNGDGSINNNTWQKYWEYTDRGSCFSPPLQQPLGASRQDLIMVDNCFYTMRLASVREVIPISIAQSPPDLCRKLAIAGVVASGFEKDSPPISVIDNKPNTRWANLGVGSWIQLDLGTTDNLMNICSLDINFYQGDTRQYSFIISLSNNGQLYTDVFTGKNTRGTDNYILSRQQNTTGRFVRLTVNGNTENKWASVEEITVYGFPTTNPAPVDPPICPTGLFWNAELQKCDNKPGPGATDCYPGLHYDTVLKKCIPNNAIPIAAVTLDLSVNNVHYIADINSTTTPIDAKNPALLPSGRHFLLTTGDINNIMFRVGTLAHDPLNPLWWKFKGGIQDVRIYREYLFTSLEVTNLYNNKMTISPAPYGQIAVAGFATYFDTQVSPGGFHIAGFHAMGFHTGQTPGLNDPGQQSTEDL